MKKVELHVHLDGSVRESTLRNLLASQNIIVDESFHVNESDKDLNDYLKKFDYPIMVMQTKENLTKIAYELVCDLASEDVIYAEVRFAPIKHIKGGLSLEEVVLAVKKGLKMGNIKTSLILCCMRDSSLEENKKIVDLANKLNCSIDLAGAEAVYDTSNFKELFEYVKNLNIPYTIHAGEACGKDSILSALKFGTKRIGHGIKDIDDEIIELYKKNNITLELCPTSNINTNVVADIRDYPIFDLYKKGIHVTINTDNRTVSNTTLEREYKLLKENFDLKEEDIRRMNEYAINSAFISELEKRVLMEELYN